MCGIAGELRLDGADASGTRVRRMIATLRHRGPDGEGLSERGPAALGHRRLSIVDLEGGAQPMGNEDGTVEVVFNGEIYNAPDLRRELAARGHRLATRSDTEVIVHLWEERGAELVHALRGMFAFALWDAGHGRGLLARDRLGIKPLFTARDGGALLFASEIKALLQTPGVSRELDPAALDDYLAYGFVPAPRTIHRGVKKLPPGTLVEVEGERAHERRWWTPPGAERGRAPDDGAIGVGDPDATAADALRGLLEDAVREHLMSDVPLGVFLSGGMDSSVVAALAARRLGSGLTTFTVRFEEAAFDEGPFAREVARHLGTKHEEAVVRMDAIGVLPRLVRATDEPFADSSAIPTWYLSRFAAGRLKVCLSGDGGDESFAGYDRYARQLRLARLDALPGPLRRAVSAAGRRLWPEHLPGRGALEQLGEPPARRYQREMGGFDPRARRRILAPAWRDAVDPGARLFGPHFAGADGDAPEERLARMQAADLAAYLPDDILTKVDRTSMAHSLEVRVPLLDHRIVELAAALPARFWRRDGGSKWLLKRVAADLLPPATLERPKAGFTVPLRDWLRGPLGAHARELLLSPRARDRGLLDPTGVERLLALHGRGGRDWSARIYALLFLETWCRAALDGDPLPEGRPPEAAPGAPAGA